MSETFYRFEDKCYAYVIDADMDRWGRTKPYVELREFPVIRRTPKGAWIMSYSGPRFVNLEARKRYALPTKEEALESFIARKTRQARILRRNLEDTEYALGKAKVKLINKEY